MGVTEALYLEGSEEGLRSALYGVFRVTVDITQGE